MRKKILINVFLLAVMAFATIALIGFIIWNKPHRNIKDAIAVETNAVDLYQALSRDSAKMKKLFLNKVVSVAGKIKQVQRNREGALVILLETAIPGASVNCTMEEKEDVGKPGDSTELRGICIGYISGDPEIGLPGDVFLTRCYVSF